MMEHAKSIVEKEGLTNEVSEDVIAQSVIRGKGSVRDTLSHLERLISSGGDNFTSNAHKAVECLAKKDLNGSLQERSRKLPRRRKYAWVR